MQQDPPDRHRPVGGGSSWQRIAAQCRLERAAQAADDTDPALDRQAPRQRRLPQQVKARDRQRLYRANRKKRQRQNLVPA